MNQYAQMIRLLKTPDVMKRLNYLYGQRDGMLMQQTTPVDDIWGLVGKDNRQ